MYKNRLPLSTYLFNLSTKIMIYVVPKVKYFSDSNLQYICVDFFDIESYHFVQIQAFSFMLACYSNVNVS